MKTPEYRLRSSYVWAGLLPMVFFAGMLATSVVILRTSPAAELRKLAPIAYFSIVFWSGWCCLCIWLMAAAVRERLRIDEAGIWQRGVLFQTEIAWSEIAELQWYIHPVGGSAVVRAENRKITIYFSNFEHQQSLAIISQLRAKVPPKVHADWERFCFRIALPRRSGEPPWGLDEGRTVVRYRSSWDLLFLPIVVAFSGVSAFLARAAQMRQLFLIPLALVAVWFAVRYTIPKAGRTVKVRKLQPSQVLLVRTLGAWAVVLIVALTAIKLAAPEEWQERLSLTLAIIGCIGLFASIGFSMWQAQQQEKAADQLGGRKAAAKWSLLEQYESGVHRS